MRKIVIGIVVASLAGCSMGHRDPVEIKQSLNQSINEANSQKGVDNVPQSVESDLMPNLDNNNRKVTEARTLKRFRIQAKGVSARAFFPSLVKGTGYSVALHPGIRGRITVDLTDVTLDDVLRVVEDMYGYDIERHGKVIQVFPAGMRTVSIPVNYLQFKRTGRSVTNIATGSVSSSDDSSSSSSSSDDSSSSSSSSASSGGGGTQIETVTESDFWPNLQKTVEGLVGHNNGQKVVTSPQAGIITVHAFPDQIREVRNFLGLSQKRLQRQVILEAKILEVTLNDGYQQGINWSNLSKSIGSGGVLFNHGATSPLPGMDSIGKLLGGQSNVTITDGNFTSVLHFMATQGDLNVLSSPRVTATNNQKSVIKVGTDAYYVTDYSSVVGSSDNSNTAPDIDLTPFFSGISLDVTPQIDAKGNVLLHVHPAVIDVAEENKTLNLGGSSGDITLPLARSSIRESDSVVRAHSGDVIVIGGLMKTEHHNQTSKVPLLGDIPVIGNLFRNTSKVSQKTELVILLKPTVIGVNSWQKELARSRDLLQEWFPDEK